jgi:hypothetical protein
MVHMPQTQEIVILPGLPDSPADWSEEQVKSLLALIYVLARSTDTPPQLAARIVSFFMDAQARVPEVALETFRARVEQSDFYAAIFQAVQDCTRAVRPKDALPNVLIGFRIPGAETAQPLLVPVGAML